MKKNFLLGTIVAVSMMALVGCGGSDGADPLVGTWETCENDADKPGYSEKVKVTFNADGTYIINNAYYDELDCAGEPYKQEGGPGKYKTGAQVNASDGAPAIEIDVDKGNSDDTYYFMYRLKDNNNRLFFSKRTEDRDASTDALRANYFDPSWKGYTKVK